ncbi:hypothetical protein G7Y89_g9825 [Cudoniella acicularis]|uniref:Alpha/beta hydrolase fold-3 domain-containing protein n=1 Tax=Cudoniella acicularis TaxID=354080 RepID=A0A8H4W279_9HELO|nr:hypothetical protein G7Y89_g9825 [Cudoniella acicularis]
MPPASRTATWKGLNLSAKIKSHPLSSQEVYHNTRPQSIRDLKAEESVEVGSVQDVVLKHTELRIFTPKGKSPAEGWPVFPWFRGGGWTLGNIDSDNGLCTHIALGASCIAVNVNYRQAPENPFPAAIDDVFEALQWMSSLESSKLGVDRSRIVIGGTSSGGNLAAVLSMKAALATPPIPIVAQLLVLLVIDNTALPILKPWITNHLSPFLTPARMLWFRRNYLSNEEDWHNWSASPNLASSELLQKPPNTWIAVAEYDLLAPEGIAYGY